MTQNKPTPFRGLDKDFMHELLEGKLNPLLKFERKYRLSFMVEIRNNFLDLYFLGHGIEVKRRRSLGEYYLSASNRFNPKPIIRDELKVIVKDYGPTKNWQTSFYNIERAGDINLVS